MVIPSLKEGFVDIGVASSKSKPSKFQGIWDANPELERYAKDFLEALGKDEIELTGFLNESDDTTAGSFSILDYSIPLIAGRYPSAEDLLVTASDTLESFSKQTPVGCPVNVEGSRFLELF